jgi:putative lipoic acid-binding regulatory protein
MDQSHYARFKKQLTDHYDFPALYLFKFIVPIDRKDEFKNLFPDIDFKTKDSKNGKYISFSRKLKVKSSDEIIDIYNKAYSVKDIISL